jgi:hypothetical protein
MRPKLFQTGLLMVLLGGIGPGCRFGEGEVAYPPDPLLAQKKPLAGKPTNADSSRLVLAEPVPPNLPAEALVERPPASRPFPMDRETEATVQRPSVPPSSKLAAKLATRDTTQQVPSIPVGRPKPALDSPGAGP